ncbi:MAG: Asp23/Gls24 family envelope stress response protein [Clostridiales bacterium]|jgi:uncharacterized alkaline shock family protein YloU|nr:Asp23/Gls24 family envelope stress response protein [Clostridiales bacterium]
MTEFKTSGDCASVIHIADEVVSVIAGAAAMDADGTVVPLSMLGKKSYGKGVKVSITDNKAVIDININVKFGFKIQHVAEEVQKNVKNAVETMTALEVTEVNVFVVGVDFDKKKHDDSEAEDAV